MNFGLLLNNTNGTVISPNITPISLYLINCFNLDCNEKKLIETNIESDNSIIAFVRTANGQGCQGLLFDYVILNGKWSIKVFSAINRADFILYIFSNKTPDIPKYGFCIYNKNNQPIFHNECLPLKIDIFDTNIESQSFTQNVAVQACMCEVDGNYSTTPIRKYYGPEHGYITNKIWVPSETVRVPGKYVSIPGKYIWENGKYVWKDGYTEWQDGYYEVKPGYWKTEQVWGETRPGRWEHEGYDITTSQWSKFICAGDKKISINVLSSTTRYSTETSLFPPFPTWYGKFTRIRKIAYIKCDFYDKYFQ
ncbi:hypothetical protein RHO12_06485 [Orbus sturtevantii]|uniref:hypothetical protein n=1 Tax=Orbus sturtevantii TaxID=3074109 RepID=UPI00370D6E2F